MNSKVGASHVRKQPFHEDECTAFRIALDVKETKVVDLLKNIDQLKSTKEFLRIPENFQSKIMRKKNTLKDRNINYDEKGTKDTITGAKRRRISKTGANKENIGPPDDMEQNKPLTIEKDSELIEKSTGTIKKKIKRKNTIENEHRQPILIDATNTIHSRSDDVRKKGRKSKVTRVLAEKENRAISQDIENVTEEAHTKKRRTKKGEKVLNTVTNDSVKESNGRNENPKHKSRWQVQPKEKKNSIKEKDNIQTAEKSSNLPEGEKKRKVLKKTRKVLKNNDDIIENVTHRRILRSHTKNIDKIKDIPEIDEKDCKKKKTELKEKKTRAEKTMFLKEGEDKTSKSGIEGNAGNEKTKSKKSKNKRNEAAGNKNAEYFVDGESSSTEVTKNNDSDSEEVKKSPFNVDDKEAYLLFKKQLEESELKRSITLENIDQSIFKKLNLVYADLKNDECNFQDKSFEKHASTEVMESPYLFEKENNNSKKNPLVKARSASALYEENKCEKPKKMKTFYEIKRELKKKMKEIRYEKKVVEAVEKLSVYTSKYLTESGLDSNPAFKHHLGLKSNPDSDSETSWDSENSHWSDCESNYDSSSCSCSDCCSGSSYFSAFSTSSDSSDYSDSSDSDSN